MTDGRTGPEWVVVRANRASDREDVELLVRLAAVDSVEFPGNSWEGPLRSLRIRLVGDAYDLDDEESARFLAALRATEIDGLGEGIGRHVVNLADFPARDRPSAGPASGSDPSPISSHPL